MPRTWIPVAAVLALTAMFNPALADTTLFCAVGGASHPKLLKYQVSGTKMTDVVASEEHASDTQSDRDEWLLQVIQDTPDALVAVRNRKVTETGRSSFSILVTTFALNKRTGAMREMSFSPDQHEPDQEKEGQCSVT